MPSPCPGLMLATPEPGSPAATSQPGRGGLLPCSAQPQPQPPPPPQPPALPPTPQQPPAMSNHLLSQVSHSLGVVDHGATEPLAWQVCPALSPREAGLPLWGSQRGVECPTPFGSVVLLTPLGFPATLLLATLGLNTLSLPLPHPHCS